jgi:hypothetical protein
MVNVEQKKGDTAQYKHYLGLLVQKYKATGDAQSAAIYQTILDKAK